MITKFLKIKNGKLIIKTNALGVLTVKKQFRAINGIYDIVAANEAMNSHKKIKTYYVIYGFNSNDGTVEFYEVFKGKNALRTAIRCLNRYLKSISTIV